jgi:thymidylate synthase (FAD)
MKLNVMRRKVLDHGYVQLIETWGSDERIVEAARMSTGKGFLGWDPGPCPVCQDSLDHRSGEQSRQPDPNCEACNGKGVIAGDQKLLAFLFNARPQHATPFEMGGMVIEVMAPIFIFREWHRHRTQSYNEMSGRYVPLPNLNYIPTVERLMLNSKTNKQAGTIAGAGELTEELAKEYRDELADAYEDDQSFYEKALRMGVPKELARVHIPVGRYSRMRASTNLRNWLAFLTLRCDSKAMWEIQCYANVVADLVRENFDRTYDLFVKRLG